MQTPTEQLDLALGAFRREQALSYIKGLLEPTKQRRRARDFLCSDAALELLERGLGSGELPPHVHAAACAHLARAHAEQKYAPARQASAELGASPLRIDAETSGLSAKLAEWRRERSKSGRARLEAAFEPVLGEHAADLLSVRARADSAAHDLLTRLSPARHADAGPEGGVAGAAEDWLARSADLTREAFNYVAELAGSECETGTDALWAALGGRYQGLFPRPGRYRRLAAELDPFGLRRELARSARLAPEHDDPFGAVQVAPAAAPHDVRVIPARAELGLASELSAADALGRAAAYVHASPALPFALRHASAGTVARAIGGIAQLRFSEPAFLRRKRELNKRESGELARAGAAYFLCETRLLAAAVLARGLSGEDAPARAQVLCERALLGPVAPGTALFLTTRLSASSAFRGKLWSAGVTYALRERFDEDWYANPHAGDALRGAAARAGELSVEALASELGARIEDGPRKLSELF